ncbi:hypothetical protein F4802DRAFT_18037 [Xylaria palmicola]|nr:hypothetical protein F4802DRAFT_18037 [Xylaria palmicola]
MVPDCRCRCRRRRRQRGLLRLRVFPVTVVVVVEEVVAAVVLMRSRDAINDEKCDNQAAHLKTGGGGIHVSIFRTVHHSSRGVCSGIQVRVDCDSRTRTGMGCARANALPNRGCDRGMIILGLRVPNLRDLDCYRRGLLANAYCT